MNEEFHIFFHYCNNLIFTFGIYLEIFKIIITYVLCFADTKEVITKFSLKTKFTNRAFGDTEDSHFLFYFSIMTILSMLFYLALYNKKKVSIQLTFFLFEYILTYINIHNNKLFNII